MDIHALIEQAKESLLTHGTIMPMISLELFEGIHLFVLDVLSDAQSIPEQCGILSRLGWEHCKEHPGQPPLSIGFFTEAWRLQTPANSDDAMRPVKSSRKQEIIAVSFWQADGNRTQTAALPIIRDQEQRVAGVGPIELSTRISVQLAAFRQGCLDAQKPDAEVFARLDKALDHRLETLSSEQKADLREFLRREGL